jgi:D-sedoheptulose 7-phosphate isomerase
MNELKIAIEVLQKAHQDRRDVYLIANGGSAGFLSHWEVDWVKGVFLETNFPLKAISIPGQLGLFSAACNDFGWEKAFQKILSIQSRPGDVLVSVSSSGESRNIIQATEFARENGLKSISLSGFGSTSLSRISEIPLAFQSRDMQVIEDCHHIFGHLVLKSFGGQCQK